MDIETIRFIVGMIFIGLLIWGMFYVTKYDKKMRYFILGLTVVILFIGFKFELIKLPNMKLGIADRIEKSTGNVLKK